MSARVWLNSRLMPAEEARIAPDDRGFTLADGLFETLLVRAGRIVRLDAHLDRLAHGAGVLGIPLPAATRTLRAAARETVEANGLLDAPRASLRITVTRGPGARGLASPADPAPTVVIAAAPAPPPPAGVTAITSTIRKVWTGPASALKTLNYTDNILARREAEAAGAGEALMLSERGGIACATAANIFAVAAGRLVTPPDDGAIRCGIARADVLALARQHDIPADERPLSPEGLKAAEEVFLTNSVIGVCPVTGLDGAVLEPGPVTRKLARALESAWASDDA